MSNPLNIIDIEEGFHSVVVYRNKKNSSGEYEKILKQVEAYTDDAAKEAFITEFLLNAATCSIKTKLRATLDHLQKLVSENKISSRALCEQILKCEGLRVDHKQFWIESFGLIRRVLSNVDYKGVREVLKGCKEKALQFPTDITSSVLPQMKALITVIEYIFDRNACLLPAYFIINEIQKAENVETHWRLKKLISDYVEQFVDTAQMLSIIGFPEKLPVVEFSAYVDHIRLDPTTLRFILKGQLPYNPTLLQPQTKLLRYVLEQPCSRDFVCSILNLNKNQRTPNPQLEQNFIWLIVSAMEKSELVPAGADDPIPPHWLHLSSQLIYFVLFSFVAFANIVTSLHQTLAQKDLRRGRNYLMWVLLQFISGSIQRNPLQTFLPMLKLFDILYPEKEPLPVPNIMSPACTHQMAATCIWLHLTRKAQLENQQRINRTIPPALKAHFEFLQAMIMPNNTANLSLSKDYSIALLCNAYSTNQDFFSRPMGVLIDTILGPSKNMGPTPTPAQLPTVPLSMSILDSLTVHSKMSLIHSIVTHMIKQAQAKSTLPSNVSNMAPALVETYSRLLVYTEIESLGIKGFLTQLLPTVFKNQAWGILYTLLEMFSYRIEWHIQPHYRVQLLSHLQTLASLPQTDQNQLHNCVEFTALRLIAGFSSSECKHLVDNKPSSGSVISNESEELNRLLVLTLARSMHVTATGNDPATSAWCKDLLVSISGNTPLSWNSYTLNCFPAFLKEYFTQHNPPRDVKQILKTVDDEYRNWMSMNENDIVSHFSSTPTFLCVLFKTHLESDNINPVALKVLERIGARLLVENVRKLCDYVVMVSACSTSAGSNNIMPKAAESINAMIWKYHIFTIDRFMFCLALRSYEGTEVQISFYLIQLILIKTADFRNRTQEFVKENSPEHWKQTNWFEKHDNFHKKFPEKFSAIDSVQQLPVYFGNVCLRLIPVIDIIIHRLLEILTPTLHKTLEFLLDHLGSLYKFHDRPITYLYNTLHYYEIKLRDKPLMKKKLVATVVGSLHEVHPPNWALSDAYRNYIKSTPQENENELWSPDLAYYIGLVRRLLDTIDGKPTFPSMDWRFNEFPNCATHGLYTTCVELLALPVPPATVTNNLIDVIVKGHVAIGQGNIHAWINVVGLIISRLPEVFWNVIFERLQEVMQSTDMREWTYQTSPFQVFNFKACSDCMVDKYCVSLLAIAQSVFHHFGIGQISMIMDNIKKTLKPIIKQEYQLIYLCHIVGPFIQRLEAEIPRAVMNLTALLYEVLEQVDKNNPNQPLNYIDPVCDLLYHLKYQYIGDTMKNDLEVIIKRLRQPLRMKLRFITRLNVEEMKEDPTTAGPEKK